MARGCLDEAESLGVDDPVAAGLLPADWLGLELGVAPPTFVDRGKVQVQSEGFGSTAVAISRASGPFDHGDPNEFDVTDYRSGHHYDLVLPDNIGVVAEVRAQRQLASQPADRTQVTLAPESKSISGGEDTRRLLSVASGVGEDSYAAAVGELEGGLHGNADLRERLLDGDPLHRDQERAGPEGRPTPTTRHHSAL